MGKWDRYATDSPPSTDSKWAAFQVEEHPQATLSAPKPLSWRDFFPTTGRLIQKSGRQTPFIPTPLIAGSAALDVLGLAPKAVDIAFNQAQRAGARPLQSPMNALRTGLRGPEETLEQGQPSRIDPFFRLLGQTLPVARPAAPVVRPVARVAGELGEKAVSAVARPFQQAKTAFSESQILGRPSTLTKPSPFRERLIERVRQRLLKAPKLAGQEFEAGLDELTSKAPDTLVDLSASVRLAQAASQRNPSFQTLLKAGAKNNQQATMIQSVLTNPETASQLTLRQAQEIKQVLQRSLKQKFQQVSPERIENGGKV